MSDISSLRVRLGLAMGVAGVLVFGTGLGLMVEAAGAAPSSVTDERGETCDKLGYTKFDRGSGKETIPAGTLSWSGDTVTFTANPGWTVELCVKGGSEDPIIELTLADMVEDPEGVFTYVHPQDISHVGWRNAVPPSSPSPTPTPTTTPTSTPTTTPTATPTTPTSTPSISDQPGGSAPPSHAAPSDSDSPAAPPAVPTVVQAGSAGTPQGAAGISSSGSVIALVGGIFGLVGALVALGGRRRGAHQ